MHKNGAQTHIYHTERFLTLEKCWLFRQQDDNDKAGLGELWRNCELHLVIWDFKGQLANEKAGICLEYIS